MYKNFLEELVHRKCTPPFHGVHSNTREDPRALTFAGQLRSQSPGTKKGFLSIPAKHFTFAKREMTGF